MMSRRVMPQEQGELQGAIGSLRGLAALFAPLIFTSAFAFGIARALPGAAWFVGVAFLALAVLPVVPGAAASESAIVAHPSTS